MGEGSVLDGLGSSLVGVATVERLAEAVSDIAHALAVGVECRIPLVVVNFLQARPCRKARHLGTRKDSVAFQDVGEKLAKSKLAKSMLHGRQNGTPWITTKAELHLPLHELVIVFGGGT